MKHRQTTVQSESDSVLLASSSCLIKEEDTISEVNPNAFNKIGTEVGQRLQLLRYCEYCSLFIGCASLNLGIFMICLAALV